jgi:hypothetical protein
MANNTTRFTIRRVALIALALVSLTAVPACGNGGGGTHSVASEGTSQTAPSEDLPRLQIIDHGEAPTEGLDFGGVLIKAGASTTITPEDVQTILAGRGDLGIIATGVETAGGTLGVVDMWTGLVSDMNVHPAAPDAVLPPPPANADQTPAIEMIRDHPAVLLVIPNMKWAGLAVGGPAPNPAHTTSTAPLYTETRTITVALDAQTGAFLFLRTV